ncbi:MAG: helix-turn-helix domain-containing protein [Myxococcota bacterium]
MGRPVENQVRAYRDGKTGNWHANYNVLIVGRDGTESRKRERPSLATLALNEGLDPAGMPEKDALRLARVLAENAGALRPPPRRPATEVARDHGAMLRARRQPSAEMEPEPLPAAASPPASPSSPPPNPPPPPTPSPLPTPEQLLAEVVATLRARGEHATADMARSAAGVERVGFVLSEATRALPEPTAGASTYVPGPPSFEWLRVPEAAKLIGVSRRQVYALAEAGMVPHLDNPLRFERARLVAWIEDRLRAGSISSTRPAERTHQEAGGAGLSARVATRARRAPVEEPEHDGPPSPSPEAIGEAIARIEREQAVSDKAAYARARERAKSSAVRGSVMPRALDNAAFRGWLRVNGFADSKRCADETCRRVARALRDIGPVTDETIRVWARPAPERTARSREEAWGLYRGFMQSLGYDVPAWPRV